MADIKYTGEFVDNITPKLQNLQKEVKKTSDTVSGLTKALGAVTAALSVGQLVNYTATWTDLNSKMRNAVGDAGAARAALDAIASTAQRTFTSLEQTAETFLRNSQTLKELGYTTSEQINLSEALNNALAISGTKGQEAQSVMNALSKAFANGKLSGDNFNTVLQSAGRITQALADGLGVTTLELRNLATTGRLETGVVIDALTGQLQRLRAEADAMPATIKDSFVILNNSIAQFVGKVDDAAGTSEALANILVKVSKALDTVAENAETIQKIGIVLREIIVIAGTALSVFFAFRAAKLIWQGFSLVLANIGSVIKVVTTSVGALVRAFKSAGETIKNFFSLSPTNKKLLKEQLDQLPGPAKKLGAVFNETKEKLLEFAKGIPIVGAALTGLYQILGRAGDAITDWNNAGKTAAEGTNKLVEESGAAERAAKAEAAAQLQLKKARNELNISIQENLQSYRENNQIMLDAMKLRNQQIGMDEEQIRLTNALAQNEQNYFKEYSKIQKEIAKLRRDVDDPEKTEIERRRAAQSIEQLQQQQRELGKAYQETGVAIRDLVVQQTELMKVEAKRKELQSVDRAVENVAKQNKLLIQNIELETAKLRLSESQRSVVDQLYSIEEARLNAIAPLIERINELKLNGSKADQELIPILEAGIDRINKKYGEQLEVLNEVLAKKEEELRLNSLNDYVRKQQLDTEAQIRKIQDETAKLTLTDIERKYYDIAAAARESARAAIEAEEARRGTPLSQQEKDEFYRVAEENARRLIVQTKQHNDEARKWSTGWKKAYKDYADDASNAAKKAEKIFKTATQGMEDAIVSFAKTGKFEWKGFVNSILEELLRAQVRQLIAQVFSIGGSVAGGGSRSGSNSLFGGFFATGGMIPPGRFGVVGEAGPELVQGPANVTPMQPSQVIYNINAVDALSFKQMLARDPSFLYAVTEQGRRTLPQNRR